MLNSRSIWPVAGPAVSLRGSQLSWGLHQLGNGCDLGGKDRPALLETNPEIEQAHAPATAVTVSKRQPEYIWRDVLFGQLTATVEAADQRPEFAAMGLQEGYHPPILGHREFAQPSGCNWRAAGPRLGAAFGRVR